MADLSTGPHSAAGNSIPEMPNNARPWSSCLVFSRLLNHHPLTHHITSRTFAQPQCIAVLCEACEGHLDTEAHTDGHEICRVCTSIEHFGADLTRTRNIWQRLQ